MEPSAPVTAAATAGRGVLTWLPWAGLVVVAGVVGGLLGPLGAFGHTTDLQLGSKSGAAVVSDSVDASICIGGGSAGAFTPGERVLAVARSKDSTYLGLRDPEHFIRTVWVPAIAVTVDPKQDVASLPVGGVCPVVTEILPVAPVAPVVPVTPVKPGKPVTPPVAKDTTPPTIGTPTAPLVNCATKVIVTAADNVGVTSVSITWTGANTGSGSMSAVSGHWEFTTDNTFHDGSTTFKVTAHDAAGNISPTTSVTQFLQCLI